MKVVKVDLFISKLIEDLNNGVTWLASEDAGNGSIQEKYNIRESDVANIRKHPRLKGLEPTVIQINIIDDLEAGLENVDIVKSNEPEFEIPKPVVNTTAVNPRVKHVDETFEAFNNI